jgi:hypothetical protein
MKDLINELTEGGTHDINKRLNNKGYCFFDKYFKELDQ